MSSRPQLNIPPLGGIKDPAVVSALQAISVWAKNANSAYLTAEDVNVNSSNSPLARGITRAAADSVASSLRAYKAVQKPPANIVREIMENSGTEPPIILNAPAVFQAGTSQTKVYIGAGGLGGTYAGEATWGITAADGSFFFGKTDAVAPDPAHKQIIFDATTGVFQFGKSIVVQRSNGPMSLDEIADAALSGGYTKTQLNADLASGVASVVAGVGGNNTLEVNNAAGYILIAANGASFSGAAPGVNRPAVGISSAGVLMGHNRASDGAWVNAVAIDASGNASFAGTINATSGNFTGTVTAGSVISNTAQVNGSDITALGTTATWGGVSSRPANIAALTGTENILNSEITIAAGQIQGIGSGSGTAVANSSISIQSNGLLVGGGGGQVTIGGLGYTGVLDATRNTVTYAASAPASPANGDLWCDTSVSPNQWKIRVSDVWQVGANNITTSTPVANYIAASSITADRLSVSNLSAISANLGTITAGSLSAAVTYAGSISAGQISAGTITAAVSIDSAGAINATGTYGSSVGNAAVVGNPGSSGFGVVGMVNGGSSAGVLGYSTVATAAGVYGWNTSSGVGVYGYCSSGVDFLAEGSAKVAFSSTSRYIRYDGSTFRVTDSYATDMYPVFATATTASSSTGATLSAKLAGMANTAQQGWITIKVNGVTAYVPYWT